MEKYTGKVIKEFRDKADELEKIIEEVKSKGNQPHSDLINELVDLRNRAAQLEWLTRDDEKTGGVEYVVKKLSKRAAELEKVAERLLEIGQQPIPALKTEIKELRKKATRIRKVTENF
jgi:acyl carrier protein phosphodiesterase